MPFCPALQHQCRPDAGSNRRWQTMLLLSIIPKAKKGDHAIRKIITQASRGGYDADGALELRGCNNNTKALKHVS